MGYDLTDAARVCTHARAFSRYPSFGPVFGVDPAPERRKLFNQVYGGPSYASVPEALVNHQPTVAVIATPTDTHSDTLRQILEASEPRIVLCEKPLAHDCDEAEEMLCVCEERGVALYVNYMRRADPGVAVVKQMIEIGEIQSPVKGMVWYSKGLVHNGSHFIDLIRHWLGRVQRVALHAPGRRWEDRDPEPDFLLELARGSISFRAANEEYFSHYTVELITPNGRLRYEGGGERIQWQAVVADPDFAGYRILAEPPQSLPADMGRSQLHVVEQLELAARGEPSALCTGREGLATLRDIYRVLELL
jgi:predicted dehydrogenase